jgi:hypothetical protein
MSKSLISEGLTSIVKVMPLKVNVSQAGWLAPLRIEITSGEHVIPESVLMVTYYVFVDPSRFA